MDVLKEIKNYFKEKVFKNVIPLNIKIAEAPSYGKNVIDHFKNSKGAQAYIKVTEELKVRLCLD